MTKHKSKYDRRTDRCWRIGVIVLGAAVVALTLIIPSFPVHAVTRCGDLMLQDKSNLFLTALISTNSTPGVYPPYPYVGTTTLPVKSYSCSMDGYGDVISIGEGQIHTKITDNGWVKSNGGWWIPYGTTMNRIGPNGDRWGPNFTDYSCNYLSSGTPAYCYRARIRFLTPLTCAGADGVKSATVSNGELTISGGGTATVPCRDVGGMVNITLPTVSIDVAADSAHGYFGWQPFTPIVLSTSGYSFGSLPLGFISLGKRATAVQDANTYCSSSSHGPCLTRLWSGYGPDLLVTVPSVAIGACTASQNGGVFDWGTIPGGSDLTVGNPIPGVPPIRHDVSITCTGGQADHASRISLVAHGDTSGQPYNFATTNDSIAFQLRVGSRRRLLNQEQQLLLTASDGATFSSGSGGRMAVFDIEATPVAKLPTLLPGLAKTTVTLDVYAVSD